MEENKKETGLNNTTIVLMVSVALFYDALQWLLGWILMGWLASFYAFLTFYIWFKLRGMSFMTPKRLTVFGGSFIVEMIPVIGDILPTWTAAIVYLALDYKAKKALSAVPGGQLAAAAISKSKGTKIKRNNEEALNKFNSAPKVQGGNKSSSASPNKTTFPNQTSHNTKPSFDLRKPEQKAMEGPKNTQNDYQPYKGYQSKPDWMFDKKPQQFTDLRNQRIVVAKEMGMDMDQASTKILDIEKKEEKSGRWRDAA